MRETILNNFLSYTLKYNNNIYINISVYVRTYTSI